MADKMTGKKKGDGNKKNVNEGPSSGASVNSVMDVINNDYAPKKQPVTQTPQQEKQTPEDEKEAASGTVDMMTPIKEEDDDSK